MTERQEIIRGLAPMFAEAKKKGLWFYCNYQGLWFSPDELKGLHKKGRFLWGAVNWQLRDPSERVLELVAEIDRKQKELAEFSAKVSA